MAGYRRWIMVGLVVAALVAASAAYAGNLVPVLPTPVWEGSAPNQRLVSTPLGVKVGVGIAAPDTRLHVAGGNSIGPSPGDGFVTIGANDGGPLILDNKSMPAFSVPGPLVLDNKSMQAFSRRYLPNGIMRVPGLLTLQPLGAPTRIGGKLDVRATRIHGALDVMGGRLTVAGDIVTWSTMTVSSDLTVNGSMQVDNSLRVRDRTYLTGAADVSYVDGGGALFIGDEQGMNLAIDGNEILARDDGAAATLYAQAEGGDLFMHSKQVSSKWFRVTSEGRVIMGRGNTSHGTARLVVDGTVVANAVRVTEDGWPDYVFEDGYDLMPLTSVRAHVEREGRLPGMPSAAEVESDGVDLGEIQKRLLQKVEELTLHAIAQDERIAALEQALSRERAR